MHDSSDVSLHFQMEQQNSVDGATAAGDKSQTGGAGGGGQAQQTKQTELAFKLYDKDKDGYITRAEMVKLSKNLTKEQVEKVFGSPSKNTLLQILLPYSHLIYQGKTIQIILFCKDF